jgi:hypothetical protein
MTTRILTTSLGALAPYLAVGSLVLSPGVQGVTHSTTPEPVLYVRAAPIYRPADIDQVEADFKVELGRPDLIPNVIVSLVASYPDSYEPFIISEGWREEASLEGPFLVEEEASPVVEFDDYDRATIALYE